MNAAIERQNRALAGAGTILFVVLLMLLFWLYKIITPIPPFPGSGEPGIEVNFGFSDEGMGTVLTEFPPVSDNNNKNNINNNSETFQENYISEDNNESFSVKPDKKPNQNKKNNSQKETDPKPDKDLEDAFKNFSNNSGNDGITNSPGNQGKENGTNNSNNYNGDGFSGNGGKDGPGIGNGPGKVKFNLKGRMLKSPPDKITDFSEEAIIVVDIIVDQTGKVIYAEVNRSKSVNPNYVLSAKARQAAFTTKFNSSPDGTLEQKGTITFEFSLK